MRYSDEAKHFSGCTGCDKPEQKVAESCCHFLQWKLLFSTEKLRCGVSAKTAVAVIGVGVNYRLGERALDRIDQPVADVAACASPPPSRSALLAALLSHLGRALEAFDRQGFAGVLLHAAVVGAYALAFYALALWRFRFE